MPHPDDVFVPPKCSGKRLPFSSPVIDWHPLCFCSPSLRLSFRSMPAPFKNQNAGKPPSQKASVFVHMRVRSSEKRAWSSAAGGKPLSAWIREILNSAARAPNK